jgi:hypothetical protein
LLSSHTGALLKYLAVFLIPPLASNKWELKKCQDAEFKVFLKEKS